MPLPALSSTQLPEAIPDWTPLDRKRVLEHFMLSRDYENIAEYISFQSDLLPDERVILFFLHAVYANSTKTIELYALYIIGLFNYAKKSFNQLKAWDIDAYLRHLTNKGLKPSSRNTAAATLRSFFRHLVDSGVCTVNPAAFLKRKRNDGKGSLPGHLSHSLGRDELERLFAGMEEVGAPFRDIVLFRVLFMTGLRAEEAVSLKWMNVINWQGRWYLDVLGKGSKVRRCIFPRKPKRRLKNCGVTPRLVRSIRSLKTSATEDAPSRGTGCMLSSRNGLPLSSPEATFRLTGFAIAVSHSSQAVEPALKAFRPLPDMRISKPPCTTTRRPSLCLRQVPSLTRNNRILARCCAIRLRVS